MEWGRGHPKRRQLWEQQVAGSRTALLCCAATGWAPLASVSAYAMQPGHDQLHATSCLYSWCALREHGLKCILLGCVRMAVLLLRLRCAPTSAVLQNQMGILSDCEMAVRQGVNKRLACIANAPSLGCESYKESGQERTGQVVTLRMLRTIL
jgi:hypothetical protein